MFPQSIFSRSKVTPIPPAFPGGVDTFALNESGREEILTFLSQRPEHTMMMTGLILDNGLVSPLNRGTFYSACNHEGELEGVALIGHATLLETRTDRAVQAFADLARESTATHMIMGEAQRIDEFWPWYSESGQAIRRACRECLLELTSPIKKTSDVPGLRLANKNDLDVILPVHAQLAFEESGVDPLRVDPEGFRARYTRRIEQDRTWILIESGTLVFKVEIVSDTPDVTYLEGIWTNPERRSAGYGTRCLLQLARQVFAVKPDSSVCVFVNEENSAALRFYRRAGFEARGIYDTAFLN